MLLVSGRERKEMIVNLSPSAVSLSLFGDHSLFLITSKQTFKFMRPKKDKVVPVRN
jgi:hypothetical protein